MAHPKDDVHTRARGLDTLCYEALELPDVPEPRRELLTAIKSWAQAQHDGSRHVPRPGSAAMASLERQLASLKSFVQEDRRVHQSYDGPRQNTRADGTGQPVIYTDPRLGAGTIS